MVLAGMLIMGAISEQHGVIRQMASESKRMRLEPLEAGNSNVPAGCSRETSKGSFLFMEVSYAEEVFDGERDTTQRLRRRGKSLDACRVGLCSGFGCVGSGDYMNDSHVAKGDEMNKRIEEIREDLYGLGFDDFEGCTVEEMLEEAEAAGATVYWGCIGEELLAATF